ncbi:hypothetical protein FJZ41_00810 [Candidatus Shapirobacteria bacterium]|nr:hypothetical protein [Candidatus Shapirobacteria bacterium]
MANVWLIGHDVNEELDPSVKFTGDSIKICWGDGSLSKVSMVVALVYRNAANVYKVIRQGYDANAGDTVGFEQANSGKCTGLAFAKDISLTSGIFNISGGTPYLLRLKLLYNEATPQPIVVESSSNFPTQGRCYDSSATIETSQITRKIRQCQFYQAPPEIFDYVLFSEEGLTK